MLECILADRLYVPEEYVTQEHLNAFVYQVEETGKYDYGPFQITASSIRTFAKVNIAGNLYYGFAKGNVAKLGELFGDLPWLNKTVIPPMESNLEFRGKLHTWESKKIGQQEAVDTWLKHKNGIIRGKPRFGKCCVGDTIIHTLEFGSIPIKTLFSFDHIDGSFVPKRICVASKEGNFKTSFLYKKSVDKTIKIITRNGFEIEATPNHPLFIKNSKGIFDWKILSDIRIGDIVAIQSNTQIFAKKQSAFIPLYVKYIRANKKYAEKVLLRVLQLKKEDQRFFLDFFISNGEIELDNIKVLKLLQIMLLNFGYVSRLEK